MRLVGYVLGVVLVVTFLVRGVILPIARGIGGKDADKPVEIQAETETVEADPDAAIRKPLKGKGDLTKASDLTAGWHEDENGKWYQNFDGTYYAGGFQEIDGVTYSFDDNGYIQTGWVSNGFDDLYFNEDGSYNPDKHKTLDIDHIKPLEHYPELGYDMDNLQTLCIRHHNEKENRFNKSQSKKKRWNDEYW